MSHDSWRSGWPVNGEGTGQVELPNKTLGAGVGGRVLTFLAARSDLFHRSAANSKLSGYASLSLSPFPLSPPTGEYPGDEAVRSNHTAGGGSFFTRHAVRIAPIRIPPGSGRVSESLRNT